MQRFTRLTCCSARSSSGAVGKPSRCLPMCAPSLKPHTLSQTPPSPRRGVNCAMTWKSESRALADVALSATNVWTQPALPDDEGVQTRYSSYPTASLLLVRDVETLDAQTVRLHLLDGTQTEASAREWDFDAAKSIHRNLARLPRWAVAAALQVEPRPAG